MLINIYDITYLENLIKIIKKMLYHKNMKVGYEIYPL